MLGKEIDPEILDKAEERVLEKHDHLTRENLEDAEVVIYECAICSGELYEFRFDNAEEVNHSCYFCGWNHLVTDDWGDERGLEWLSGDHLIPLEEDIDVGDPICHGCYEDFNYHPDGTIVLIRPGIEGIKLVYMGGIIEDFRGHYPELTESEKALVEGIVAGSYWRSSDAWRGAIIPPSDADGWIEAVDGWHSSMTKTDASDTINDLGELAEDLSIPIAKVFTTTSNVCATGVSVYVKKKNAEKFKGAMEGESLRTGLDGAVELTA